MNGYLGRRKTLCRKTGKCKCSFKGLEELTVQWCIGKALTSHQKGPGSNSRGGAALKHSLTFGQCW